jgi:hypothetical protein
MWLNVRREERSSSRFSNSSCYVIPSGTKFAGHYATEPDGSTRTALKILWRPVAISKFKQSENPDACGEMPVP